MSKLLSIKEAAKNLGVSTKTLRRWESKGVIIPKRTVGNQRRYSSNELQDLKNRAKQVSLYHKKETGGNEQNLDTPQKLSSELTYSTLSSEAASER